MELAQENGILDNLVARLIPVAEWVNCWWDVAGSAIGSAGSPVRLIPSHTSTRTRRVLEVAEDRNYDGESTVTSKGIAEQFRNDGYEGSVRDLSVSVGNILTRSKLWVRVGAGEYERVDREYNDVMEDDA